MPRKEFIRLMEENVFMLDRLADKLKIDPAKLSGYPRQLMQVLVRLNVCGKARLKDIARREGLSAPNLCASFRKLEQDGLVLRIADEKDRRNVWYDVTNDGHKLAERVMNTFREGIDQMFSGITGNVESRLTGALKELNSILSEMEHTNDK